MNINKKLIIEIPCPGCKEIYPNIEGPIHPYIGASTGCWKIYGEVLAREFNNPEYFAVHRLTVDAYSAQHPGTYDCRAAQSVSVHLVALYLVIEKQLNPKFVTKLIGQLIKQQNRKFEWLTPPESLGKITINDVWQATNAEEHTKHVQL